MIKIHNELIDPNSTFVQYPQGSIERKIIDILSSSEHTYNYDSQNQLEFEINLRKKTVEASIELYRSHFLFRDFPNTICNSQFWDRTDEGGFLLKNNIRPSDAIKDIYINSSKYGTECSTAIVIVFLKALVDIYPATLFDKLFQNIYLMNWHRLDSDLGIQHMTNIKDYLPGDCRYFINPDVDPSTPVWQGENAIDLGNGTFYGHGIGIKTADQMIYELNKHRKPDSDKSAYLLETATRPNYKYLAARYLMSIQDSEGSNL